MLIFHHNLQRSLDCDIFIARIKWILMDWMHSGKRIYICRLPSMNVWSLMAVNKVAVDDNSRDRVAAMWPDCGKWNNQISEGVSSCVIIRFAVTYIYNVVIIENYLWIKKHPYNSCKCFCKISLRIFIDFIEHFNKRVRYCICFNFLNEYTKNSFYIETHYMII